MESSAGRRVGKAAADSDEHTESNDELLAKMLQEGGEDKGVFVEPLLSCPHLSQVEQYEGKLPRFDELCESCKDGRENWLCLSCQTVACGRYIGGHMVEHWGKSGHALAMGFRDLSVWCFPCEAYLDAQVIPLLRPYFEAVHLAKFGTPATSRIGDLTTLDGATIELI